MAAKKRQRKRSSHPGVVLFKRTHRSGAVAYCARYRDPDSGRNVDFTFDPLQHATAELRKHWAVRKSKALAKRRLELEDGQQAAGKTPVGDAIDGYYGAATVGAATLANYKHGIERFRTWAAAAGHDLAERLQPSDLAKFRQHLVAQEKRSPAKGAKRGTQKVGGKRAATTTNGYLRSTKIVLQHMRRLGQTPLLSSEAIKDNLAPLPEPKDDPEFLRPAELKAVCDAVILHDLATFKETRREHLGIGPRGLTYRYLPIAAYFLFLLLSGCRGIEARRTLWAYIDLHAYDGRGHIVGEIRLPASATKTNRARTIGLEVSPLLRELLMLMKEAAGRRCDELPLFGPEYTKDSVEDALVRLRTQFGAPRGFTWKRLRATCDTFLVNAPGIFGSSATFLAAKQLGHSVAIAESNYQGVHRGIPRDASTLEAAMEIEMHVKGVIEVVKKRLQQRSQG